MYCDIQAYNVWHKVYRMSQHKRTVYVWFKVHYNWLPAWPIEHSKYKRAQSHQVRFFRQSTSVSLALTRAKTWSELNTGTTVIECMRLNPPLCFPSVEPPSVSLPQCAGRNLSICCACAHQGRNHCGSPPCRRGHPIPFHSTVPFHSVE